MIVHKKDDGYYFKNSKITDPEILEYIKKLVIPPNYTDVKIFYVKNGQPKILYQGYDSKMRLQRIYSELWNKKAARKKFCELLNFSKQINKISEQAKKDITLKRLSKNKMIAMIIRIVMLCYFRIGNRRYQELYGSFGAMNIQKRHITFKKDNGTEYMYISFSGKKQVVNTCNVYDRQLIAEIKEILKFREDREMVFQWLDGGVNVPVRAVDINLWLKKFDPTITSKAFRTYDANILLIIYLRAYKPSSLTVQQRKKVIVAAMKSISEKIHNTPAVLKKNYTAGGIIDMFMSQPVRFKRYFLNDLTPRTAFANYLKDYCA